MENKRRYLSWKDVEHLIEILHQNIIESNLNIKQIYGIPRGGYIPSVILSHKMNIPLTTYKYTPNTLIIDDICDTGKTLQSPIPIVTGVLHYKPHTSEIEPSFYACKFNSDDWIIYPWENKDSKAIQDYKN
tara:strand:+ start:300 stop:692 length:393 start_codon:yes stop_codon:yes gene_type:complete